MHSSSIVALLCITAQAVLADQYAPIPSGITQEQLYANLGPMSQFSQGYGDDSQGGQKMERIDNAMVTLPTMEETQQGKDEVIDHMFPAEQEQNRVDKIKEIHNFQLQKKITNVNNRVLHRYLKELLVNTIYNTNVQKVNHAKIINLLMETLQETHQPKLLVKYSRQDQLNNLGDRSEAPVVEQEQQNKVLPAIFLPASAEKIGYNGQSLGGAISASSMNAMALAKLSQRTNLPTGLNYNNGQGYLAINGGSSSSGFSSGSSNRDGGGYVSNGPSGYQSQQSNGQDYSQQQQQSGVNDQSSAQGENNNNYNNQQQQQQANDDSNINNGSSSTQNGQQQGQQQQGQQQQAGAYINQGAQQATRYQSKTNKNYMDKYSQANSNLKEGSSNIRK